MLVVMAVLTVVTFGAVATLSMVTREASLEGQSRRDAEAFFAAEAGLAEGKERLRLLATLNPNFTTYSSLMAALPPVLGIGANGETWYEVLPSTAYGLTTTGTDLAIDPNVTTFGRELIDPTGARFPEFPQGNQVSYHVFLRDDLDETPAVSTVDSNGTVWVVSVGEVAVGQGMPVRRVTQALISFHPASEAVDCTGQKGGCADKTNSVTLDGQTPTLTTGARSL